MRRWLRLLRSLTFRLALLYLALFTVSVALIIGLSYWAGVLRPLDEAHAAISRETEEALALYERGGREALITALNRREETPAGRRAYHALIGPDGRPIASNLPTWPARREDPWLRFEFETYESGDEVEHEAYARNLRLPDGSRLIIGRDTEDLDEREDFLSEALFLGAVITLLFGLAGGVLMSLAVARRVEAVTSAARTVIAGDLSGRVKVLGTGDDFDQLAETLNLMLARIEELVQSVSRVSDSIAHELRTPLTRLHADIEDLLHHEGPSEERAALAAQALEEANRLQSTFDALLRIARIETGRHAASTRTVDLSALLEDAVELYRPAAEDKAQVMTAEVADGLKASGDPDLLFQAVSNLLDNAIKYAPEGGRVALVARVADGAATVAITDDGPGIPEAYRAQVTERFFRIPQTEAAPGLGLGLSLVAAVARMHRAKLTFEDAGPGLRVVLRLPTAG